MVGGIELGRVNEHQTMHGWLRHGNVKVLDNEEDFGRAGWERTPGEVRGEILPSDPLAGVRQRDGFSFLEVSTRHGDPFWSLQVWEIPR
jgi:hypothetical protein